MNRYLLPLLLITANLAAHPGNGNLMLTGSVVLQDSPYGPYESGFLFGTVDCSYFFPVHWTWHNVAGVVWPPEHCE